MRRGLLWHFLFREAVLLCVSMRKIIHIDMDAFYASVEQRDHPDLRGRPVVVGGPPDSRSVVCTASYEARKFGVRSAMACSKAYRLCPDAVFVFPRFEVYKEVSDQIRAIFVSYTDLVEPLSLDEAYLDVTSNKFQIPYAVTIARQIKARIKEETGLTASAGVASGKFLAKIASGMNKPDGLTVILPDQAIPFLEALPVGDFFGVGKVTEKKMKEHGIFTGADLKARSLSELVSLFGKSGMHLYRLVRGIDEAPVMPFRERKSVGIEDTFSADVSDVVELMQRLRQLAEGLAFRLAKHGKPGRTITVKVKYADFETHSKSETRSSIPDAADALHQMGRSLLEQLLEEGRPVRLLGLSVHGFISEDDPQLQLFD
ncbi:MAG: DNA polymerase IV [Leptonema illini]|uniref:DNA polymerase IV n=1 Tax=Leptonema illini TaxID=183 RepID=A0A833GZE3_9LEPT|nr:MAG: DNA polymerase IV [Leptonema illini]